MSALHASVISSGIIYVYGTWGTTGDGFNAGSDSTGDGRATAPYASVKEAMNQLHIWMGTQALTQYDKNYYVRIVSNTGETNAYTSVDTQDLVAGLTVNTFDSPSVHVTFQGWDRAMGDVATPGAVTTTWTEYDGTDRPQWNGQYFTLQTTPESRCQYYEFKDLRMNQSGFSGEGYNLFNNNANTTVDAQQGVKFWGCVIEGGWRRCLPAGNGTFPRNGFTACLNKRPSPWNNGQNVVQVFQNCTFVGMAGTGATGVHHSNVGTTYIIGCVVKVAGGEHFYTPNFGVTGGPAEGNVYGGPAVFHRGASSVITLTMQDAIDAGRTMYDITSVQVDPQFEDEANGDYRLKDGSPGVANGCNAGALAGAVTDVVSGRDWARLDFMNNEWSDSIFEPIVGNANSCIALGRSSGYIQSASTAAPNRPEILYPKTTTAGNITHFAFPANQSPQGGTVQCSVELADDISFLTNLQKWDSFALKVTASNNKINFKEDGGAERTATIAVGDYNTATLATAIKAALEGAPSATGTYDVTYDSGTNKWTIAPTATVTNIQLLFLTGTDVANTARTWLGFRQLDTANTTSLTGDEEIRENHYDASIDFDYASDWDGVSSPSVSGTWNSMGNGEPGASGVPGTDGANGDGTYDIRTNIPSVAGIDGRHVRAALWSGTRRPVI